MELAGNIVGSLIGADSARSAANTQSDATREAIAEQRRQSDRAYADNAPYRAAGANALDELRRALMAPTTAADVMADPGYQFALDQGQQALDRKFAASGGRISGAAMKSASRFNTGTATSGFSAADQRRENRLARLQTLAGYGQSAVSNGNAIGQMASGNISGLISSQGDAAAAAKLHTGNLWGNTANSLAALWQRGNGGGMGGGMGVPTDQTGNGWY